MTTVVASCNMRFTVLPKPAEDGLRKVLADRPHLVALQEWGTTRDRVLEKVVDHGTGPYQWTRPKSPNGDPVMPAMWHARRYRLRAANAVLLARRELVGHLPGRKSRLPASWATEVILDGLAPAASGGQKRDGTQTVLLNYHLTAEVQQGAGYRTDLAHRLRVARHKRERRRLERRARTHVKKGRTVHVVGDGNFDGMTLAGLVSCWQGRKGGTLGDRAVDIAFGEKRAAKVWTLETASDHDALVCIYP